MTSPSSTLQQQQFFPEFRPLVQFRLPRQTEVMEEEESTGDSPEPEVFMEEEEESMGDSPEPKKCQPTINVNRYATTKTIASGMLDFALLTANASQLNYILRIGKERYSLYTPIVTLISISICLQVTVGVCIIYVGSININRRSSHRRADILNNLIAIKIFLITVINVIISSFGIEHDIVQQKTIL